MALDESQSYISSISEFFARKSFFMENSFLSGRLGNISFSDTHMAIKTILKIFMSFKSPAIYSYRWFSYHLCTRAIIVLSVQCNRQGPYLFSVFWLSFCGIKLDVIGKLFVTKVLFYMVITMLPYLHVLCMYITLH